MKKYKRMRRLIPAAFAVILLLMAAGTCFFAWSVRQDFESGIKSMIGELYEEDPQSAEQMMNWLFEGERDASAGKGQEALTAMGYTEKGTEYLYEQSRIYTFSVGMICAEILAGAALLILFLRMERLREEREEDLVRRIRSGDMAPETGNRRMAEHSPAGRLRESSSQEVPGTLRRSRRNRSRRWSMRLRSCLSVWRRRNITCRKRIS